MKIVCKTADLKTAISFTGKVINKNTVLPILEGYLFDAGGKVLKITTTDLENYATKAISCISVDQKMTYVLGFSAAQFIKVLTEETVTIDFDLQGAITITSGKKVGKFMVENAKDFPPVPMVDSEPHVITDDLQANISKALKYVSSDDLRPAMTGILFGKTDLVATDAHRLFQYSHSLGLQDEFICPPKTAALAALLKDCKLKVENISPSGLKDVNYSGQWAAFYNKTAMIVTRAIDARYPDYKVVIPKDNEKKLKCKKADLKEAINTVMIAANNATKQVMLEIDLKNNKTTVRSFDCDFGMEATAEIESKGCNFTSDLFKIAFNSQFLLTVISDTEGEDIELLFDTPSKAGLMKKADLLILLMPLIINGESLEEYEQLEKAKAEQAKKASKHLTKDDAIKAEMEDENDLKEEIEAQEAELEVEELSDKI